MKVLVTGASGFIGRSLLLRIPKDWEIVAAYLSDGSFLDFIEEQGNATNIYTKSFYVSYGD